jgi:hypothetical protein
MGDKIQILGPPHQVPPHQVPPHLSPTQTWATRAAPSKTQGRVPSRSTSDHAAISLCCDPAHQYLDPSQTAQRGQWYSHIPGSDNEFHHLSSNPRDAMAAVLNNTESNMFNRDVQTHLRSASFDPCYGFPFPFDDTPVTPPSSAVVEENAREIQMTSIIVGTKRNHEASTELLPAPMESVKTPGLGNMSQQQQHIATNNETNRKRTVIQRIERSDLTRSHDIIHTRRVLAQPLSGSARNDNSARPSRGNRSVTALKAKATQMIDQLTTLYDFSIEMEISSEDMGILDLLQTLRARFLALSVTEDEIWVSSELESEFDSAGNEEVAI